MNALKQIIDYVKEDGEFSKCKEQVELAIKAEKELEQLKKELAQLRAAQPALAHRRKARVGSGKSKSVGALRG
jgi:uncharacterized membrane protein